MKDPCEECIVKVNCTSVCPKKKNYQVLVANAIHQNRNHPNVSQYFKRWKEHQKVLEVIAKRSWELKNTH